MSLAARYRPEVLALWAWHECFRRLGFTAAEIHLALTSSPLGQGDLPAVVLVPTVNVVVKAQGRQFVVGVAQPGGEADCEAILERWAVFVGDLTAKPPRIADAELETVWTSSDARRDGLQVFFALRAAGFALGSRS